MKATIETDLGNIELELDEKQLEMVYEYLKNHNIGVDEAADTSFDLSKTCNTFAVL